jgi:hypothetical protein
MEKGTPRFVGPRAGGAASGGQLAASAYEELADLETLEEDWDSYGGAPPSPASIARARRLIEAVEQQFGHTVGRRVSPYDVAPIPRGGVQVEWRGTDVHLEVEVGPEGDLSYLLKKLTPTGREYEEAHNVSWEVLSPRIERVLFS